MVKILDGHSPLTKAISQGDQRTAELLLKHNADPNALCTKPGPYGGVSPLMMAGHFRGKNFKNQKVRNDDMFEPNAILHSHFSLFFIVFC